MKYDDFGFRTHTNNPHSDSFLTVYVCGGGFMRGDFRRDFVGYCKSFHYGAIKNSKLQISLNSNIDAMS